MGLNSCCVKQKQRKGLWSPEEDEKLYNYITRFGVGCWSSVPKLAGLQRCGKSCRLRWINYLRPDLKRGMFSQEEEDLILNLHEALGNRWAQIAAQLPGRTDNEIKNFWNSSLKKKLLKQGVDPNTHKPINDAQVVKDERDLQILQQEDHQQAYHVTGLLCDDERKMVDAGENNSNKQVYGPLFLSEFQPNGFQSSFLSHCHQTLLRTCEQSNPIPICGFNSMPNLTNFDRQNIPQTQYSQLPSSRINKFVMNEMNNNVVENGGASSWDDESKLDSVFQFQFSGIQIQERDLKLQNQGSDDFTAYSSLTALPQNMNMFDHRI